MSCKKKAQPPVAVKILPVGVLTGSWQLTDVELDNGRNLTLQEEEAKENMIRKIVQEGIMVSFFEDGSLTSINGGGKFTSGKWEYADHKNAVKLSGDSATETVYIKHSVKNGKQCLEMLYPKLKAKEIYFLYADSLKNYQQDPFYADNNRWRIRPDHKESSAELQSRLGNYFQHLIFMLSAAQERHQPVIAFGLSMGIVKIYDGGIGVEQEHSISFSWKHGFYDDAQAIQAYDMYKSYMEGMHYRGKSSGNWMIDDSNILSAVYKDLKAGKFPVDHITASVKH